MTFRSANIERPAGSAGTRLLRAFLRQVDVDRPRRIDDYIDYFGNGSATEGILGGTPRWGERDLERGGGLSRRRRP